MASKYQPVRLSTDEIPEKYRDEMIRDFYGKIAMRMEVAPISEEPLWIDAHTHSLPGIMVSLGNFSAVSGERTGELLADGNDDIFISVAADGFNASRNGSEVLRTTSSEAVLTSLSSRIRFMTPRTSLKTVQIKRSLIAPLSNAIDDPPMRALSLSRPEVRLLFHYVDGLADLDLSSPLVMQTVATHLTDLASLAIGATREAAEIAHLRGLRAARVRQVLSEIKAGYADPAFSVTDIARNLRLSPRYVQDLLHETGESLSARILELRLHKAHAMLADRRNINLRVSEIALTCGFSDISYFNQSFRRRYGATPSDIRAESRLNG